MKTISINKDQQLYVLPSNGGYSCLGFTVCFNKADKLNTELSAGIKLARKGSKRLYSQYLKLVKIASERYKRTGIKSQTGLIPEFIGREGWRVEVTTSYGETNRYIIGKSTGWIPCHLEIKKSNSMGGSAVFGYPFKKITFLERVK